MLATAPCQVSRSYPGTPLAMPAGVLLITFLPTACTDNGKPQGPRLRTSPQGRLQEGTHWDKSCSGLDPKPQDMSCPQQPTSLPNAPHRISSPRSLLPTRMSPHCDPCPLLPEKSRFFEKGLEEYKPVRSRLVKV